MFFVQDFHGSTPYSSTTSVTLHILAEPLAHSTRAELHRPDSSEHHPIGKDKLLQPSPQQVTDTQLREKSALKAHLVTMVHVFVFCWFMMVRVKAAIRPATLCNAALASEVIVQLQPTSVTYLGNALQDFHKGGHAQRKQVCQLFAQTLGKTPFNACQ